MIGARYDYAAITPDSVRRETEAGIATADRLVAMVVASTADPTFENTLLPLSDAAEALWIAEGRGALMVDVHPDAAVREAASRAREQIERWRNSLAERDDVAAAIAAFAQTPSAASLPTRRRRVLELWLRDLRRAGHSLPPAARAELATLRDRIVELAATFGRQLREWSDSIELSAGDLEGLSETYVDQLPDGRAPGSRTLPIVRETILPFLEQSTRRDLRELVLRKDLSRAAPENGAVLEEIVALRRRIAGLMGAPSWSDYANEVRMSRSAAAVARFLDRILPPLRRLATDEQARMRELLLADGVDDDLRAWDWFYYHERQRRSRGLDSAALSEHLPLDAVLEGLFSLVRDVFGVMVAEVDAPRGWHQEVRLFAVTDVATGEHLGDCYLDPFARPGKSPGAWSYPLEPGSRRPGTSGRPAVAHLVMNLTPGRDGQPPLLTHDDVVTVFHEFGHTLESTLGRAEVCWSDFASWTERDFIEGPSQIMEHWAWSSEVLRRFARHYRTGAPPGEALIGPLAGSRPLNGATAELYFLGYKAALDQAIHGPQPVDLTDAYRAAFELTGLPFVEGTFVPASFFHVVTAPYDAGYYGYLWAEAIGDDMFTAFRSGGLFSPEVGRRYREAVLEPGWLTPGKDRVRAFLGREPSEVAYLERLGIAPPTTSDAEVGSLSSRSVRTSPWTGIPRPLGSEPRDVERATRVLCTAFADDPVSHHVDPDPARRRLAVRAIFDALLGKTGHGLIVDVVGDPIDGVAIWLPPDDPSDELDLWSALSLPFPNQLERFREAMTALDRAHEAILPGRHWYLLFVATEPSARRHGIGSSLVRAHDADADAADVPCGLETFGDDLCAFYVRLGWEVASTSTVGFSAEPLHSMLRRPVGSLPGSTVGMTAMPDAGPQRPPE